MSENLDLVRAIYAGWERGDFSSVEWAHPDIEYVHADGPARGTWKGLGGMAQGWREWLSAWRDLRIQAEQFRELDDGRVFVIARGSARGKTSGLDTDQIWSEAASVFHIRGGKVVKLVLSWERDPALARLAAE